MPLTSTTQNKKLPLLEKRYVLAFTLVTVCFALWGFANDITNPMVKVFGRIYQISTAESSLVQLAFYGGYFMMALPAALLNQRTSYRTGIIVGLTLYAIGALLFYPGVKSGSFSSFLLAYFILTCGLSFLETSANPYILTLGDPKTATQRLNLAQAFNPIGSLIGMFVAVEIVQKNLHHFSTEERVLLPDDVAHTVQQHDLHVLATPYIFIGLLIVFLLCLFVFIKLPTPAAADRQSNFSFQGSVCALWSDKRYRYGVLAQFFYVGAQIMVWTFIIQYGVRLFTSQGLPEHESEILSQRFNILAMVLFCGGRFGGAYLSRRTQPEILLRSLAIAAIICTTVTILFTNIIGLIALVLISVCMSIMFPTIYAQSLQDQYQHSQIGAAGLIMAILGGSVLPPLQGLIIDMGTIFGHPAVNISFVMPLLSFVVVLGYALFLVQTSKD